MDYEIKVYDSYNFINDDLKERVAQFLFTHLDEYGDPIEDIIKSIDYIIESDNGGKILLLKNNQDIFGVVVLNNTGMSGYIPETILVYIAVNRSNRGQGIGKFLMEKAIEVTNGNIALHVEEDNPAKHLYERVGFTKKYAEMRYIR